MHPLYNIPASYLSVHHVDEQYICTCMHPYDVQVLEQVIQHTGLAVYALHLHVMVQVINYIDTLHGIQD